LHRDLTEFDSRFSNGIKLSFEDAGQVDLTLVGAGGKRLTYRTTCKNRRAATVSYNRPDVRLAAVTAPLRTVDRNKFTR
jgi:hypothetical protein